MAKSNNKTAKLNDVVTDSENDVVSDTTIEVLPIKKHVDIGNGKVVLENVPSGSTVYINGKEQDVENINGQVFIATGKPFSTYPAVDIK